ncbi:hypothetical protein SNE40_008416 [Patella caerulea]
MLNVVEVENRTSRNGERLDYPGLYTRRLISNWKNLSSSKLDMWRVPTEMRFSDNLESDLQDVSDEFPTRLTKGEFRRLTDQVRDVSMSKKNNFRTSNCQVGHILIIVQAIY